MIWLSYIIVACFSFSQIFCEKEARVKLSLGEIEGRWKTSLNGRPMAVFLGVPYASSPVGDKRFEKPEPVAPWEGIKLADKPPQNCIQWLPAYNIKESPVEGSEDCLYMNIYSSNLSKDAALPVMVFIHGGAFTFGYGFLYEGDYLLDNDVVYININYRLGALGFMSTEDEVVPGNAGMKDQVMALRFIKENIEMFGGDPNKITIMGMSAGGASVNYHMISPLSSGLFNYAFSQSGTVFAPWTFQEEPLMKAKMIGSKLGCPTKTTQDMVACLKGKPAIDIVKTSILFMPYWDAPFSPFAPVVEKVKTNSSFITEHPYELIAKGSIQHVPWITSITKDEGLYPGADYYSRPEILPEIDSRWDELAPLIFDFNLTLPNDELQNASARIREEYFNGEPLSNDTFDAFVEALGDRHFKLSSEACARLYAKSSMSPVFFYKFTYRGKSSMALAASKTDYLKGTSHADDTGYILKTDYVFPTNDTQDHLMMNSMIDMLLSFMNTGVPKFGSTPWIPVDGDRDELDYLEINGPDFAEMKTTLAFGRKGFWDSLNLKENENVYKL